MSKRWLAGVGVILLLVFVVFLTGYSSSSPTGFGLFDRFRVTSTQIVPPRDLVFQPVILCGNGRLDTGEECDDRNLLGGDRCSPQCRCTLSKGTTSVRRIPSCPNVCGDGVVVSGEECDDGNRVDFDGCSVSCRLPRRISIHTSFPVCGDGVVERGEECDDGNDFGNDGCDSCLRNPVTCYACGEFGCGGFPVDGADCGVFFSNPSCSSRCDPIVIDVPPNDGDRDGCAEPNPFNLPPGTRFRDYIDARHISTCEDGDSARYTVCGDDGEITVSIADCNPGVPCEEGSCIDDPRWRSECFDSDGGVNPGVAGEIIISGSDGSEEHFRDRCVGSDLSMVNEQFCMDGESGGVVSLNCPVDQRCDGGVCVSGDPEVTCEDSEEGQDIYERGTVTIFVGGEVSITFQDSCPFTQEGVNDYFCQGNSVTYTRLDCPVDQHCDGGVCVPGDPPEVICEDSDGRNRNVRGSITRTREDGAVSGPFFDICSGGSRFVTEYLCGFGGTVRTERIGCTDSERCENGACIEVSSCSRTAATDDAAGFVTDREGVVQHDICEGDILHVFQCDAGTGMPSVAENIVCERGCENGLCL